MESKIAFFVDLKKNEKTLNGADLNAGNPGVGGTQYLFLLTVLELNKKYGSGYAVLLTDGSFTCCDSGIELRHADTLEDAIRYCEKNGVEVLVINANLADRVDNAVFHTSVAIILWAHNTLTARRQKIAASTESIKKVVCVSEAQYENMSDTPCFDKCTFVNNIIPRAFFQNAAITDYSEKKVAYIGSLMPQKGAHNLLEIWKTVEKKVPQAQLYIFGGANIWNADAVLGSCGAADPYYDKVLGRRLRRLQHPENVHFMGAKGWSFIDSYISTFELGIVNPSHYMRDETFCLSAVEMAAHGLPIVSRNRGDGLSTTILQGKTGYLEKSDGKIAERIVQILSDRNLQKKLGEAGRAHAEQFAAENVVDKWDDIVRDAPAIGAAERKGGFSKDALLLKKDLILKIGFLVESGKVFDLIKKKCLLGR